MKIWLGYKRMVVLWIKADWNLIGMTLVSAELITGGKDIIICGQKVQVYISIENIWLTRFDKEIEK